MFVGIVVLCTSVETIETVKAPVGWRVVHVTETQMPPEIYNIHDKQGVKSENVL